MTYVLYTLGMGSVDQSRRVATFDARIMAEQEQGRLSGVQVMGVHMENVFINLPRKGAMTGGAMKPSALCAGFTNERVPDEHPY